MARSFQELKNAERELLHATSATTVRRTVQAFGFKRLEDIPSRKRQGFIDALLERLK